MTTKKHSHTATQKTTQCLCCGKSGHNSRNCRNKAKLHCTFCNKQGHIESVCFTKKRTQTSAKKTSSTQDSEQEDYTFTVINAHSLDDQASNDCYLLVDCGATCHIINDASMFISYDDTFDPKHHFIELADGHRTNDIAIARGDAKFALKDADGKTANVILKGALLAPKYPTSLFSVRAATDAGAEVVFIKGAAEFIAKGTHFKLIRRGQLYFLPTSAMTSAHVTRTLSDWHRTLGHMNYNDILCLQSVTEGMKVTQQQQKHTCTTCMENKLTRTPKNYHDVPPRADKPLTRVHTDICGPIDPQSRDGYRYVINFIDEYSSMLFVYFLRTKDEASQALKAFLADVAPFGHVKEIHSDNGTEYTSRTFQHILHDKCIKHTTTAPYSPFQNGKSERS